MQHFKPTLVEPDVENMRAEIERVSFGMRVKVQTSVQESGEVDAVNSPFVRSANAMLVNVSPPSKKQNWTRWCTSFNLKMGVSYRVY